LLSANQKDLLRHLLIRFVPLFGTKGTYAYHLPQYTTKKQDKKALFSGFFPESFPVSFLVSFQESFLISFFPVVFRFCSARCLPDLSKPN